MSTTPQFRWDVATVLIGPTILSMTAISLYVLTIDVSPWVWLMFAVFMYGTAYLSWPDIIDCDHTSATPPIRSFESSLRSVVRSRYRTQFCNGAAITGTITSILMTLMQTHTRFTAAFSMHMSVGCLATMQLREPTSTMSGISGKTRSSCGNINGTGRWYSS